MGRLVSPRGNDVSPPFAVVDKEFPDRDKTTRHCSITHFDKFESILLYNQMTSFTELKS